VDHRLDGKSTIVDASTAAQRHDAGGAMAEALRELRTNLSFLDVDQPPRIIVVTSSMQAEGKSTVTANLAVTMAAAGENVVVVDGDLRRPTLVDVFNLVPGVGVTDVLTGTAQLADVLQPWGALPNLSVLGSGRIPPNPSELLGSRAMKNMLNTLAKDAVVLIDAPPLLPVTDAAVLSRAADGAIVVIRTGRTTQEQLDQSLGNLEKVKGRVLGAVLNYVPIKGRDAYSYYGTYSSAPTPSSAEPEPVDDSQNADTLDVLEAVHGGRRAKI
jgi:capsular exopolysaccharide synthesis family protein